jgi:hypothetical protein
MDSTKKLVSQQAQEFSWINIHWWISQIKNLPHLLSFLELAVLPAKPSLLLLGTY